MASSKAGLLGACNATMQVIVEKMIDYLRTASDDVQKAEVARRIGELAERFAPDTQWFIEIMNQVLPPDKKLHLIWNASG